MRERTALACAVVQRRRSSRSNKKQQRNNTRISSSYFSSLVQKELRYYYFVRDILSRFIWRGVFRAPLIRPPPPLSFKYPFTFYWVSTDDDLWAFWPPQLALCFCTVCPSTESLNPTIPFFLLSFWFGRSFRQAESKSLYWIWSQKKKEEEKLWRIPIRRPHDTDRSLLVGFPSRRCRPTTTANDVGWCSFRAGLGEALCKCFVVLASSLLSAPLPFFLSLSSRHWMTGLHRDPFSPQSPWLPSSRTL